MHKGEKLLFADFDSKRALDKKIPGLVLLSKNLYLTFEPVLDSLLFFVSSSVSNTISLLDVVSSPWQSVLNILRTECNDYLGLAMLETVGFKGVQDGYAILTVPDELRESWIKVHYGEILRKAFASVYGSQFIDYRISLVAPEVAVPQMKLAAPVVPARPALPQARPKAKPRRKLALYANYTFEKFIEGDCNSTALKACKSVAENPGNPDLNPLFVYGNSGLGKTHLLQAIASQIQKAKRDVNVMYCHAYDFLRDATAMSKALALKSGNVREMAESFREKYENCDILLLDDVQLLEKGITTQERLAILIRHLRDAGKQVVLSCDRHPSDFTTADSKAEVRRCVDEGIPCISSKLLAPLKFCVAVGLDEPDLQTRMRLIQQKSFDVPFVDRDREEICRFLSIPPRQNVRVIEGMLKRLGAMNLFCQENLDLETVKRLVNPHDKAGRGELTVKGIAETVAFEYHMDLITLCSKRQDAGVSLPRKIAMYLCRELTSEQLVKVGAFFNRDYATVIASIQSLTKLMDKDESLSRRVQDIRYLLEA